MKNINESKTCLFILTLLLSLSTTLYSQKYTEHLSVNQGISQSDVTSIEQDQIGFIWLATHNGLNKYDGYNVFQYKHSLDSTKFSISNNVINSFIIDKHNNKWIAHKKGIDCLLNDSTRIVHYNFITYDKSRITLDEIQIKKTTNETPYFVVQNFLCIFDFTLKKFKVHNISKYITNATCSISNACNFHSLFFLSTSQGIYMYDSKGKIAKRISNEKNANHIYYLPFSNSILYSSDYQTYEHNLDTNIVTPLTAHGKSISSSQCFLLDSHKNIWVGTDKNGVYLYNQTGTGLELKNNYYPSQQILSIYEDRDQNIWVGTSANGAFMVSQTPNVINPYYSFNHYKNYSRVIYSICTETPDSIWIGTKDSHLYLLNRKGEILRRASHESINHLNAICPHFDKRFLWIGSSRGLYLYDKTRNKITPIPHSNKCGYITSLKLDSDSTLICSAKHGVFTYKNGNICKLYPLDSVRKNEIYTCRSLYIEKDTLWAGFCFQGAIKFVKKDGKYHINQRYNTQAPLPFRLNNNDVSSIFKDSSGNLLIGTWGGGINILKNNRFTCITEENGLADNIVFSVNEDNINNLWISTYNGLSVYNTKTNVINSYTINDGLPSNEFTVGGYYLYDKEHLYLGTIQGLVLVRPNNIESIKMGTNVYLTDMYINNCKVAEDGTINNHQTLKGSLSKTNEIHLPYNQNSLSFRISDFDFSKSKQKSVRYKLKNWDNTWYTHDFDQIINYSNLKPGNYKLQIQYSFFNGKSKTQTLLDITINQPFYASKEAIILYCLLMFIISIRFYLFIKRQNHLKNQIFIKETKRKYEEQLYNTRMKFYTNISHELRTPLTLILGMLERIKSETTTEQKDIQKQVTIAQQNAEKLHHLINEILDLRKIETGNFKINKQNGNIVSFIYTIVSFFQEIAHTKGINIEIKVPDKIIICSFDSNITEKILYNLLSNAIKYTKDRIEVSISQISVSNIEIAITDNGKGLTEEEQHNIFTRFYQGTNSHNNEGTGIGLNLAFEIAKLQGGNLSVSSEINKGSCFILSIPIEIGNVTDDIVINMEKDRNIVLTIDDNKDITYFIDESLNNEYQVYSANNGQEAIQIANKVIPDIILCDIMMPDISGFELCKTFKESPLTCHIPVILISARSSDQIKIEGLKTGADSYITKPFTSDLLKAKIQSLLLNRDKLKEQIKLDLITTPVDKLVSSNKDKMLKRITDLIEKNLSNETYDVEELSKDMAMSRMSLYRKMKATIGQTPSEFIREYKLNKASYLLKTGDKDINEICYEVGFNDVKSFRAAFKKRFSCTPTEYKRNQ